MEDPNYYPASKLELFAHVKRSDMPDADTFDPTRPPQDWFDPEAAKRDPLEPIQYWVISTASTDTPVALPMTIPAWQSAKPNLPGLRIYPVYMFKPSSVRIIGADNVDTGPVSPVLISSQDEALALAAEWGLGPDAVFVETLEKFTYQSSDGRQRYAIHTPAGDFNVQLKLIAKGKRGKGAPGEWVNYTWVTAVPDVAPTNNLPQRSVPIRPLADGETLEYGMLGATVMVRRKVASQPVTTVPVTTVSGGVDPAVIARIDAGVTAIQAQLDKMFGAVVS
jgi:hypothetical protein